VIGRFRALIGYRRSTAAVIVPLAAPAAAAVPADAGAWDALLGPDQPIPPLELLPPPAQPDRVATMRLVTRLRQACGLEGGR
jgi:hypothetical protein